MELVFSFLLSGAWKQNCKEELFREDKILLRNPHHEQKEATSNLHSWWRSFPSVSWEETKNFFSRLWSKGKGNRSPAEESMAKKKKTTTKKKHGCWASFIFIPCSVTSVVFLKQSGNVVLRLCFPQTSWCALWSSVVLLWCIPFHQQ